jgi:hypothetical protein
LRSGRPTPSPLRGVDRTKIECEVTAAMLDMSAEKRALLLTKAIYALGVAPTTITRGVFLKLCEQWAD